MDCVERMRGRSWPGHIKPARRVFARVTGGTRSPCRRITHLPKWDMRRISRSPIHQIRAKNMAHKLHFNFAAFWPRLINQRHVLDETSARRGPAQKMNECSHATTAAACSCQPVLPRRGPPGSRLPVYSLPGLCSGQYWNFNLITCIERTKDPCTAAGRTGRTERTGCIGVRWGSGTTQQSPPKWTNCG